MVKEVMYTCTMTKFYSALIFYGEGGNVYMYRDKVTTLSYSMVKEVMYTCTETKFYSALIFYGEGGNVYMYHDKVLQRSHILWRRR